MTGRVAILAWLLELILAAEAPSSAVAGAFRVDERIEAIRLTFGGREYLVRVDEAPA